MDLRNLKYKISVLLDFTAEALKYFVLRPVAKYKYKGKKIFLVSERGTDARDNGYHFFKYLKTEHPELTAYYVITRDSADYPKVAQYGNVVAYGSLLHYLLFLADTVKISTHDPGCTPNGTFYYYFSKRVKLPGKKVFLQHGVIKDCLPSLYRENTQLDLFICGAKPEYDYVLANFHYSDQVVKYTGLARYDNLQRFETKNQILVMPTWRTYLQRLSAEELAACEYVQRWNSLLASPRLLRSLKEHQVQLLFYPHYEMQKNLHLFQSASREIVIADFAHYDVQQLLMESKLLVTDYSSVFFDFAYMKKPCLYYQFDQQRFSAEHYAQGYFDYRSMGFGAVAEDEDALIDRIIDCIERRFTMEKVFLERSEGFFPLHDGKNCERIYHCIDEMLS